MARYIDADVLMERWLFRGKSQAMYRDEIRSVPTADVAPIVHGEWIATNKNERGYSDAFACSVCDSIFQYAYQVFKECDYKYCPYCGARMDGEK